MKQGVFGSMDFKEYTEIYNELWQDTTERDRIQRYNYLVPLLINCIY